VARLGGDEFAVVVPALRDVAGARRRATEIVAALSEPVLLDGLPLDVGASVGVAVYPEHGVDFATLMQHADVAMYDAKARGDCLAVYAPESDHNSPERLGLLADLRRALESPDGAGITPLLPAPDRDHHRRGRRGRGAAALVAPPTAAWSTPRS
jgi:predicted signal transduction protein with EAL and GGDEF domain